MSFAARKRKGYPVSTAACPATGPSSRIFESVGAGPFRTAESGMSFLGRSIDEEESA